MSNFHYFWAGSAAPNSQTTKYSSNHRDHSLFRELVASSPLNVAKVDRPGFLSHLYGAESASIRTTKTPDAFHTSQFNPEDEDSRFFNPITAILNENGVIQAPCHQNHVSGGNSYRYAAFRLIADGTEEDFAKDVAIGCYPVSAIIGVDPETVEVLCPVDACCLNQYLDRSTYLADTMTFDHYVLARSVTQVRMCRLPSESEGNLLYLNPGQRWFFPILSAQVHRIPFLED